MFLICTFLFYKPLSITLSPTSIPLRGLFQNRERQWNKSKEAQFAQRFWRIMRDSMGRVRVSFTEADTVHITTCNLENSFDEFFDSMIHLKGLIVDSIDDSLDEEQLPDSNFMLELAQAVVARRMKWTGV